MTTRPTPDAVAAAQYALEAIARGPATVLIDRRDVDPDPFAFRLEVDPILVLVMRAQSERYSPATRLGNVDRLADLIAARLDDYGHEIRIWREERRVGIDFGDGIFGLWRISSAGNLRFAAAENDGVTLSTLAHLAVDLGVADTIGALQ